MTSQIIDAEKGIVKVTPKRKKVAIIGCGVTRNSAPYYDEEWECWGLNEVDQERADRWFELHELKASTKKEVEWLKKCKVPIYMIKVHKKIPMSVKFPISKIQNNIGGYGRLYFACSFAYQIAFAIYEGFEEIGLWGVNLPTGSPRERTVETACVSYWLGQAEGRGIKIHIPIEDSLLYHHYYYGYNYAKEMKNVNRVVASLFGRMCSDIYLRNI